ncbi:MAG TPA: hypothetical protein PLG34_04130 [Spirochaetota bacterium]|jgi:hypothetical protein|nr:MAG: hypothetical protein BWX91_00543 [Spirochaetes bacterium ADurb.Bin133]HNZ26927.1 hypothetical protein [Spirochaetota bacterium]HPY87151.1 hypothetical protein [Spirochaetota bacterium]HQB60376.1 hypothetical protein [Spirochaetota bacterium]
MKKYLALFILFFTTCFPAGKGSVADHISNRILDDELYTGYISADISGDRATGIYSDERTLSLKYLDLNEGEFRPKFIDKIDSENKYNSNLGYHVYLKDADKEYVLYEDYIEEKNKIFKIIQRDKKSDNWTVETLNIDPKEYAAFLHDNKVFIIYLKNRLNAYILDKTDITAELNIDATDCYNIKIIKEKYSNLFYLFYISNGALIRNTVRINYEKEYSFAPLEAVSITKGVKEYRVKLDDNKVPVVLYYSNEDYSAQFIDGKSKTQKIGYFHGIHCFDFVIAENEPIFFISTSDRESSGVDTKFYISIIYKKNVKQNKWSEDKIAESLFPVISMSAEYRDNYVYLLYADNNLNFSKIDFSFTGIN